jgi:Circularly permutated YpsA SLOG family
MIRKIISCGQTGVESAALDTAIKLGITHGGWTSRSKRNDDGRLPAGYDLEETSSLGFQEALERNVLESDGTLILSRGVQTAGPTKAVQTALKHRRQFLHVDLQQYALFEAASLTCSWMSQKHINIVFVTGPLASEEPQIYVQARKLLETAFYLSFVKSNLQTPYGAMHLRTSEYTPDDLPHSVADAVVRLKTSLSLKDRSLLSNLQANELDHLNSGLGEYIKKYFGLYSNNEKLLQSCADLGRLRQPLPDEACAVILRALWEDLRQTHKLRIIK